MKYRIYQFFKSLYSIMFKSALDKDIEIMALRQQLANYQVNKIKPQINNYDRLFWIVLSKFWNRWEQVLNIVSPQTVISWHRRGFRLFWKLKCRHKKVGRPKISKEIIVLIKKMRSENNWGAPRIHGELLKLGFDISESTISNYIPRWSPTGLQRQNWKTFLHNHIHNTVSMDFFVVPTITFELLYCLIIFEHSRRRVIHFNITDHPYSEWIEQQIREAFPYKHNYKYFIHDNDKKFGINVKKIIEDFELIDKPTSFRSPWQNPYCERMIGTIRRELLDHIIVMGESHLQRLLISYFDYYHNDRTHMGISKDSPCSRETSRRKSEKDNVVSINKVGGLHHRYDWSTAA
ncbi:MAG: transposase [Bacteriovoracaceae bacterium]|nr:transposase [Bacteriovoracaceae bacterium]